MSAADQAHAYSEADFDSPHRAFVERFQLEFPQFAGRSFRALDLGCGPADVTVRFALAHPSAAVVGIDGADIMIDLGRARVNRFRLTDRVELRHLRLPTTGIEPGHFDAVISNSVLHHLADPSTLWRTIVANAAHGAAVFVMDLCRPDHETIVESLVRRHAGDAPEVLQHDFAASLRAAYRPDEIRSQLREVGLCMNVEQTSDRHVVAWGVR